MFQENNEDSDSILTSIENIVIHHEYRAAFGNFSPSFVNYLLNMKDIAYIEPNHVYTACVLPPQLNPKAYSPAVIRRNPKKSNIQKRDVVTQVKVPSWGLARINKRLLGNLDSYTVDESAGNGIHVYIVDTGINAEHPDFDGRAIMEKNFVEYEENVDYSGHGTHVAGIIGGVSHGVAKKAFLHGIKVLDRKGDGTTASFIKAITYITDIAVPGKSIINLSLNGPRSQSMDDLLTMVVQQFKIPVFVSAGNSGDNACDYSPSANPDVFSVGATTQEDVIPLFSSHGDCVSLYAPGAGITSTWLDKNTQTLDGTSMANPHVSGIAAMLMSERSYDTVKELYDTLISKATPNLLQSHVDIKNKLLAYNGIQ
ncbi:peptidase S8/S53 domain-containing protein [Pilobolus umbonatus]|nr:peptidase S8/S53 domain-containing protein [Pilobolus umbonatus]